MRNFGSTNQIMANAPSNNVSSNESNGQKEPSSFETYFPTVYKAIWGKDHEEELIAKQARLEYFQRAIATAPASEPFLRTEINRLEAEIKALKRKAMLVRLRGIAIVAIPTSISAALVYYLVKKANQ